MDSVLLYTKAPTQYDEASYVHGKNDYWNWVEMRRVSTYYGVILIGQGFVARVLWDGPAGGYTLLIKDLATGRVCAKLLGEDISLGGHVGDHLYLQGTRIGDRIAFPYYDIPKLIEEFSEE